MMELVMYAVITVVVITKLYNVLGKNSSIIPIKQDEIIEDLPLIDTEAKNYPQFALIIEEITNKDKKFTLTDFIAGAEKAFQIIIKAVDEGNDEVLSSLLSKEVYESFKQEIKNRTAKNELHSTTIVSIKSHDIQSIDLVKNKATITVKFISEQIRVIKDSSTGQIIQGDNSSTQLVEDNWSFIRIITSNDPRWTLTMI